MRGWPAWAPPISNGLEYAPAHATLAEIAVNHDGDLTAAARHYERALELAPTDTDILGVAAGLAQILGRLDEAVALLEFPVARDPVNPSGHAGLGFSYLGAGRWDEAIASFRTALAAMQQESSDVFRLIGLALAYHALDQAAESDAAMTELIDKYEQGWAYNIAYALAFRGEADPAFEWLDKAVEYNDPGLSLIAVEILFANIHDDPRWYPFLESISKSPEQLAAIEFKVRLPQ